MRYYYIVLIAGSGQRMNADKPKQFIEHNGKPLFIETLSKIASCDLVTEVIVVTKKEYSDFVKSSIANYNIKKIKKIVYGGIHRQDSVYNAITSIDKNEKGKNSDSIVGIQDGVRPFIKEEYISESYNILKNNKDIYGVVVGVKVKDTIKEICNDAKIIKTLDRKKLIQAQTPQTFRLKEFKNAFEKVKKSDMIFTDDASIMEQNGFNVIYIDGSYENIKITTKDDLKYLG